MTINGGVKARARVPRDGVLNEITPAIADVSNNTGVNIKRDKMVDFASEQPPPQAIGNSIATKADGRAINPHRVPKTSAAIRTLPPYRGGSSSFSQSKLSIKELCLITEISKIFCVDALVFKPLNFYNR